MIIKWIFMTSPLPTKEYLPCVDPGKTLSNKKLDLLVEAP